MNLACAYVISTYYKSYYVIATIQPTTQNKTTWLVWYYIQIFGRQPYSNPTRRNMEDNLNIFENEDDLNLF